MKLLWFFLLWLRPAFWSPDIITTLDLLIIFMVFSGERIIFQQAYFNDILSSLYDATFLFSQNLNNAYWQVCDEWCKYSVPNLSFEMIKSIQIRLRFHGSEGTITFKVTLCEANITEIWYTMKSLVVILGLLVAALQVNNFKINLFMTVLFELAIELWTYVVQNLQN